MNSLNLDGEWEDGVLYKIILVQQELPIFAEFDYSPQWDLIEKTLEMDMNKEKLFSFVHPKNGKKVYMRKYAKCPANGNSELAVGTMEGPRDFARALIVLHSHMYKVPYIVLERYRHISNNPDVMAKMIERAFNWALRDTSVRVVLERWDTKGEYIDYHKDSRGIPAHLGILNLINPMAKTSLRWDMRTLWRCTNAKRQKRKIITRRSRMTFVATSKCLTLD